MITTNEVYDRISTAVKEKYPTAETQSVVGNKPNRYPHITMVEMDSSPRTRYRNLNGQSSDRDSTFEVNVYSNLQVGASGQAREVINFITKEFEDICYACVTCRPIDNVSDLTIKRYVARYSRIIGSEDTLPRKV